MTKQDFLVGILNMSVAFFLLKGKKLKIATNKIRSATTMLKNYWKLNVLNPKSDQLLISLYCSMIIIKIMSKWRSPTEEAWIVKQILLVSIKGKTV